jgi:hypothetical protein
MMPLISDIVEVRQVLRQRRLVLALLKNILFFIPIPRLVYLSKVFNNQITCLNALLSLTKDTDTFGMNSEESIDVVSHHPDT